MYMFFLLMIVSCCFANAQDSLLSKNGVCYGFFAKDRWIFFTVVKENPLEVIANRVLYSRWGDGTKHRKNVDNFPIARSYFSFINANQHNTKPTIESIDSQNFSLKIGKTTYKLAIKNSKLTYKDRDLVVLDLRKAPYCAYGECFNGDGVYVYSRGVYQGSFVDGERCGIGQFVFTDGSFYGGSWMNDVMHSKGRYLVTGKTYSDGNWVKGEFLGKTEEVNTEGLLGLIKEGLGTAVKLSRSLESERLSRLESKPLIYNDYQFTIGDWETGFFQFGKLKKVNVQCKNGYTFDVDIAKYDSNSKVYYTIVQSGFEKYDSFEEALIEAKRLLTVDMCKNY